jgi:hypothetical protein
MARHSESSEAHVIGELLDIRTPIHHLATRLRRGTANARLVGSENPHAQRSGQPLVWIADEARVAETVSEDDRRSRRIAVLIVGKRPAIGELHRFHQSLLTITRLPDR